jgi:hypothetical protein
LLISNVFINIEMKTSLIIRLIALNVKAKFLQFKVPVLSNLNKLL